MRTKLRAWIDLTLGIARGIRVIFRADTFNARNEVVLRAPNTAPVNTAFGRVTAQEPPRSWQFSLSVKY